MNQQAGRAPSTQLRRTAIVIGGDVSLGSVIAKVLGSWHVNVVIPYSGSATPANEVVAAIEASKGNAIALFADINNPSHLKVLFDAGTFAFGKVDMIIHCPPSRGCGRSIKFKKRRQLATSPASLPFLSRSYSGLFIDVLQLRADTEPDAIARQHEQSFLLHELQKALASH